MPTPDRKMNDAAIRLWQLESAMVHLRQNAAALGYGANIVSESLRAERDDLMAAIRAAGDELVSDNIDRASKERTARERAAA
jgi:hypothetical protein